MIDVEKRRFDGLAKDIELPALVLQKYSVYGNSPSAAYTRQPPMGGHSFASHPSRTRVGCDYRPTIRSANTLFTWNGLVNGSIRCARGNTAILSGRAELPCVELILTGVRRAICYDFTLTGSGV